MPLISTIVGSPSANSLSAAIVGYSRKKIALSNFSTGYITLRSLDAEELIRGDNTGRTILPALAEVKESVAVIIATPIYKAAYTGLLKIFLDILPQNALAGKIILPITTGGSSFHWLAGDYALKPVLAALGAEHIVQGIHLLDHQVEQDDKQGLRFLDLEAKTRLDSTLKHFIQTVQQAQFTQEKS